MSLKHEEEDEEETVSLSNLPINNQNQIKNVNLSNLPADEEEQFEFGSSAGLASQMCAADELFFQGQIRSISRSASMDHIINSRSSSIKSQYSYSSSSGSSTGYKPKIRNQFHSHPSPSPQIRSRSVRVTNPTHLNSKSALWSFFQTGLVRPPPTASIWGKIEINKSFGSRSSNNSSERKKKQRLFDINGGLFGSCKCSVIDNVVDFGGSEKVIGKQAASRHRTFEWLKQLSVEDDAA